MGYSREGDPPEVSSWREIDWGWVIGWLVALVVVSLWLVQAEAGLAVIGLMASVLPIVVVVMSRGAQVFALVLFAVLTGAGGWWVYSASPSEGREDSVWDYAVVPLGLLVSAVAITVYAFCEGRLGHHRHFRPGWIVGWLVVLIGVAVALWFVKAGLTAIGWMASALPIVVVVMRRAMQAFALAGFAFITAALGSWAFFTVRVEGLVTVSVWDYAVIPLGLFVSAVAITGYAFHAGEWGRHSKAVGAERRSDGRDVGLALGAIVLALGMVLAVLAWWCRLKARN